MSEIDSLLDTPYYEHKGPPTHTRRNLKICNYLICNYMRLCVVCNYVYNCLPISPNLRKVCDYTMTNVWLLSSHPPIWIFWKLYSFLNKPPWPINCMCNQNFVTNWCTMCIMGTMSIIFGVVQLKNTNIYYEYYQHISMI